MNGCTSTPFKKSFRDSLRMFASNKQGNDERHRKQAYKYNIDPHVSDLNLT